MTSKDSAARVDGGAGALGVVDDEAIEAISGAAGAIGAIGALGGLYDAAMDSANGTSTSTRSTVVVAPLAIQERPSTMNQLLSLKRARHSIQLEPNWSLNHLKLLYLLSRFATFPKTTDEEEQWLRNLPFLVMVYEAIVQGILDYDYSPVCMSLVKDGKSRRVWINVSQDAKAAVDDLREHDYVIALKTCSEDHQPTTAFQVTPKCISLLELLPANHKQRIEEFIATPVAPNTARLSTNSVANAANHAITPRPGENEHDHTASDSMHVDATEPIASQVVLFSGGNLEIAFDVNDGKFRFIKPDGSMDISHVTDIEDVSYVSSPFLPDCLLFNKHAKFSSNAGLAFLSKTGVSGIQDELSVAIVLSEVHVLVGEWIPFGPNQIVSLNERLGSLDRCQGGLFTSEIDDHPASTCLNIPPGLTQIAIVDFDFGTFTNFEADIQLPEDDGIVQIESFGMHLNSAGTIVYGTKLNAIMDKSSDMIFVDHLARLIVDIHLDSSKIITDLLSPHQRQLMDMLFMNEAKTRSKFSLILARNIKPKLKAKEYLDRSEKENELKQIIGEINFVQDLSDDDMVLIGRDGMIVVGPNSERHEHLIIAHLALLSRELFIRFFFKRTFILDDSLSRARKYLKEFEKNPQVLPWVRERVNQCSRDLIQLEEILELLRESIRLVRLPKAPDATTDPAGKHLFDQLRLEKMHADLQVRCKDLSILLRGFRAKLKQVQFQNTNMAKTVLEGAVRGVERNFGVLVESHRQRANSMNGGFDVLLALFAATLAFEIIDRVTNGILLGGQGTSIRSDSENANSTEWMHWVRPGLVDGLMDVPFLWWIVNVFGMLLFVGSIRLGLFLRLRRSEGTSMLTIALNRKANMVALDLFLQTKIVESRMSNYNKETKITKVTWRDPDTRPFSIHRRPLLPWPARRTLVTFDVLNGFLLSVTFEWNPQRDIATGPDLLEEFERQLTENGCFDEQYSPPCKTKQEQPGGTADHAHPAMRWLRSLKTSASIHPVH